MHRCNGHRQNISTGVCLRAVRCSSIGWGLAGVCPGPALVGIARGLPQAWVFMAATLAGMGLYGLFNRLFAKKS